MNSRRGLGKHGANCFGLWLGFGRHRTPEKQVDSARTSNSYCTRPGFKNREQVQSQNSSHVAAGQRRNPSGRTSAFEVNRINIFVSMTNPNDHVCAVLLTFECLQLSSCFLFV